MTTGKEGQVDEVKFSPTRTPATYDFLTVSHDGTTGEVTITLPLGSYDVTEVQAPYGFVLTDQTYTITFGWDNQSNDVVLAQTIVDHTQDGDETYSYDIVNVSDTTEDELGNLPGTIVFENARVLPVPETPEDLVDKIGVGIHKQDAENGKPLAGAVYELYTVDAIYDVNGSKLADAGTLLTTSAPTDDTGFTWFDVDVPIRGEAYANGETEPADGVWNARYNSGNYQIVEITSPDGYLLDQTPIAVSFTYPGPQVAWQVVAATQADQPLDKLTIHKTDIGGKELPGAELTVTTLEGKPIASWVSEKHRTHCPFWNRMPRNRTARSATRMRITSLSISCTRTPRRTAIWSRPISSSRWSGMRTTALWFTPAQLPQIPGTRWTARL